MIETKRQIELNKMAQKILKESLEHGLSSAAYGLEFMGCTEEEEYYVCEVVNAIVDAAVIPDEYVPKVSTTNDD